MDKLIFKKAGKTVCINKVYDGETSRNMFYSIDEIVNDSKVFKLIKDGSSTKVGIVSGEGLGLDIGLAIKCFKSGGFLKNFGRRFIGSKAESLFEKATLLSDYGLNVPEPVSFVNSFSDIESYYVSLVLEGYDNFAVVYEKLLRENPEETGDLIAKELYKWHKYGVGHGDFKWSNIMMRLDGKGDAYFIDIDQSIVENILGHRKIMDDLTRFYRYGIEINIDTSGWLLDVFLPKYFNLANDLICGLFTIEDVAIRATAEHEIKIKRRK